MAETFSFQVIKPDGETLSVDDALEVVIPGAGGYFGVRKGHHPYLTTLGVGVVKVRTAEGLQRLMVGDGFCEVGPDRVVVLAETAERSDEVDVALAERIRDRSRERLKTSTKAAELAKARAALVRAEAQLEAARGAE